MAVSRLCIAVVLLVFCCTEAFEGRFFGRLALDAPPSQVQEAKESRVGSWSMHVEPKNKQGDEHDKFEKQYDGHGKPQKKEKYPIIHALHERLSAVLAKNVENQWTDWKLWIGLAIWCASWVKWMVYGYDEIYWQRSLFVFGINIMILHILQFAPTIPAGIMLICAILGAQSLFQSYLLFQSQQSNEPVTDVVTPSEEFVCDTLYMDIMLPFEQICVLFVAQIGVWWFYMTSILGNFNFEHVNYLYWAWAFIAIQITMIFNRGDDSALGNAFPVHDVYRLAIKTDKVTFELEGCDHLTSRKNGQFIVSKAGIISRGLMGYLTNCILREIMAYTIPLMLMGFSEPMDFVVYCVGVNFICTLDDMSERKYLLTGATEEERMTGRAASDAESATA